MKKMTKKILSMILVSALVLTMGIGAFAEEEAAPSLVKTLDIEEGVTVPNAKFNFKLEELTALSGQNDPVVSTGSSGFTTSKTISAADAAADGGKSIALSDLFTNATFPHAGVYAYKLTEEAATFTPADNETLTCNTESAEYTVIVVVGNGDNGLAISEIQVRKKDGEKTGSAAFNNKYEKTNDDKALTVSKTVAGAMGDKVSPFTFTLTITKPADSTITTAPVGKIGSESVTLAWGTANTIQLKDGETLEVTGVPYGSTYRVVEAATDPTIQNYASYETKVVVNGGTAITGKDTDEVLLSDTTANTVAFTNTLDNIPVTGVIINTLPYILIVAIAAAGFFYMQMKKRV